jgi:hypothetical protein
VPTDTGTQAQAQAQARIGRADQYVTELLRRITARGASTLDRSSSKPGQSLAIANMGILDWFLYGPMRRDIDARIDVGGVLDTVAGAGETALNTVTGAVGSATVSLGVRLDSPCGGESASCGLLTGR